MRDMKTISRKNQEYIERTNPCFAEERLSQKCLMENDYNSEKCTLWFENVKTCRDFWSIVKDERRMKGITPYLPHPEERAKIKEEFLKKMNQNA